MKKVQSPVLFLGICCILAFAACVRIAVVSPIFIDAELRERARVIIDATAKREGWLKSGIRIHSIDKHSAVLYYRSHQRGQDAQQCVKISLNSGVLSACESYS